MSMQKKTLAVLVALAVGASFGAVASGDDTNIEDSYRVHGSFNDNSTNAENNSTNAENNSTNDNSIGVDVAVNDSFQDNSNVDNSNVENIDKSNVENIDNTNNSVTDTRSTSEVASRNSFSSADWSWAHTETNTSLNLQSNTNNQSGTAMGASSGSTARGNSEANSSNDAGLDQGGDANSAGLGLGLGLGAGVAAAERRNDNVDNAADGFGEGFGEGHGLATLTPTQNLDQQSVSTSNNNIAAVSMIVSGSNQVGNGGATNGISMNQGVSGHGSFGNQSVNVNASVQF